MRTEQYIKEIKIEDVPWHRLTTVYGRATLIPQYLNDLWEMQDMEKVRRANYEILMNIEHQNTLWHATPFTMIFLVRILEKATEKSANNICAKFIVGQLVNFFDYIEECYQYANSMEHAEALLEFSDLLHEDYLWSEVYNELEDEIRYEDNPFPDDLFYSFYYYSHIVLLNEKEMIAQARKMYQ